MDGFTITVLDYCNACGVDEGERCADWACDVDDPVVVTRHDDGDIVVAFAGGGAVIDRWADGDDVAVTFDELTETYLGQLVEEVGLGEASVGPRTALAVRVEGGLIVLGDDWHSEECRLIAEAEAIIRGWHR